MIKLHCVVFSCVVRGLPFYIGIIVPVVLVVIKNFIILALTLHGISKNRIKKDKKGEVVTSVRIAFACSVLLGTAWVFGIFAVGNLRNVFQWLFSIFNSLQGLFIFLFYTVRNQEARKQWRRVLGLQSAETYSLRTDGSEFKSRKAGKNFLNYQCLFLRNHCLKAWNKLFTEVFLRPCRSSHRRCSVRKGLFRNFAKFTGKHLCQSLFFKKIAGLRPAILFKKRLWHRCFPVNFAKFLRTPLLRNNSGRLLLTLSNIYNGFFNKNVNSYFPIVVI